MNYFSCKILHLWHGSVFHLKYLQHSDIPCETLHSFAQLASLQSFFLPKPRKIFMKVHACKSKTKTEALHQSRQVSRHQQLTFKIWSQKSRTEFWQHVISLDLYSYVKAVPSLMTFTLAGIGQEFSRAVARSNNLQICLGRFCKPSYFVITPETVNKPKIFMHNRDAVC